MNWWKGSFHTRLGRGSFHTRRWLYGYIPFWNAHSYTDESFFAVRMGAAIASCSIQDACR